MEAACFPTCKSFSKTPDLVPYLKARSSIPHKTRFGQSLPRNKGCCPSAITCCNLRSSPLDDDSVPSIGSDWRSFRARLVAGEQASKLAMPPTTLPPEANDQIATHFSLGEKWAHPLHEPERGCLLIASEKLNGVHIFERTVILLLSAGPIGSSGIILNRPSLMSIKETRSTAFDIAGTFSDRPLFFGGPLEEGLFLVGPQLDNGREDGVGRSGVFEEVMKGVYYGTKETVGCAAEMVKRDVVGVGDFRFFDGYCGWEREQLREEIRAGYWTVAACSPSVVELGSVSSVGLWEEVLGLVGEKKVW